MFLTDPTYQETVKKAAEFHKAEITLSEDDRYITVSAQIPQTYIEYNRNFRFWKWFFDTTIRNFGATGWLYSCQFWPDWKPQEIIPLSRWEKFLKFFGVKVDEKITPATGNPIEATVGLTVSVHKDIVLQLSKTEFDKLKSFRLTCTEEVEGDTFPYQLHLGGKIISESDPYQDKYLLEAHNGLQTLGVPSEGITGSDYRSRVTSVSLVNKANLDNCVQIADSFAIMAHIFYEVKINKKNQLSSKEEALKRLIDRKMTSKANPGIFEVLV